MDLLSLVFWGRAQVDQFLSGICVMLDWLLWFQIGREKMFQIGALIVFCGLLAQTTALLEAVPSPLDPTLPSSMIPDMEVNIPDVPGSLSSGK